MTNILLADDDHNFATVLKRELQEENHKIDHVSNGVDAVLHCLSNPYDCIILDLVMPGLRGLDALKIIKRMRPDIPVIAISGKAGNKEMADSLACGALACLRKPFEIEDLKREIKTIQKEGNKDEP